MHSTHKHVSARFIEYKRAADVVVTISFPIKCNEFTLHHLQQESKTLHCPGSGSIMSCFLFSVFKKVIAKMDSTPDEIFKYKATQFCCSQRGKYLNISWHVQGSSTAIRKSVNNVMKFLSPTGLDAVFKTVCRYANCVIDSGDFNSVAALFTHALHEKILISIVGKSSVKQDGLDEIAAKAYENLCDKLSAGGKFNDTQPVAKDKPSEKSGIKRAEIKTYCLTGKNYGSIICTSYIASEMKKIQYVRCGDIITLSKKIDVPDKAKIKTFVSKQYSKSLGAGLAYYIADRCGSVDEIVDSSKAKLDDITNDIYSCLRSCG